MVFCCVFNGLPFAGERKRILTIYFGMVCLSPPCGTNFLGPLGLRLLIIEVVV